MVKGERYEAVGDQTTTHGIRYEGMRDYGIDILSLCTAGSPILVCFECSSKDCDDTFFGMMMAWEAGCSG